MERQRLARLLLATLLPSLAVAAHAQEPAVATGPATQASTDAAEASAAAARAAAEAAAAATEAAKAQNQVQAEAKVEAKPEPAPQAQAAPEPKPAATADAAVEAKPATAPKPETKPAATPEAAAETKPAAAPQPAPQAQVAPKPEAKPAVAAKPAPAPGEIAAAAGSLKAAIAGSWRDPKNVARDGYRHPLETLNFFGLKPEQTVVEITPGGGWYSEILAPYLGQKGRYVAAVVDPDTQTQNSSRLYFSKSKTSLEEKFAASPALYGKVAVAAYDAYKPAFGPGNSADVVLTFRNVHNWRSAGQAEVMFKGFFDVLKPGGVLGVVEHRAKSDVPADDKSGYVGQAQVIALAEAAGFRLEGKSEINANPRDTKDHPNGVWTLPPVNKHDAADSAKYQAIGESDRMTLKFRKPR